MSKIVYLLGAGASFGKRSENDKEEILEGIPIVSEFQTQIEKLILKIKSDDTEISSIHKATQKQKIQLISELNWLKESSENHQTIDTFAKKLWVTKNENNYNKLKSLITVFLTLEQLFYKPDSRYDAFFANILGNSIGSLPNDVAILSWNYDCQFEIAFANYFPNSNLNTIWEHLNINGKTTKIRTNDESGFSITKINGTAISYEKSAIDSQFFDPHFGRQGMSAINFVHGLQLFTGNNVQNALSFAWEGANPNFYKEINDKVINTEVLVIIGYSFPFFNREVDRKIIQEMTKLKKVYIQDPFCEDVKENFEAILSEKQIEKVETKQIKFLLKKSTKQFLIPKEL